MQVGEKKSIVDGINSLRVIFYPISVSNNRINGIGIADMISSQSYLAEIANFYLLRFFTPEIFFFQIKSDKIDLFKGDECDYSRCFVFINGKFEFYNNLPQKNIFSEYADGKSKESNPLTHLVMKSNKIREREKKCFLIALKFGFPCEDIINPSDNILLNCRTKILSAWDDIIQSQHGSLERDFINTLKRGSQIIKEEYSDLFNLLAKISQDCSLFSTKPLFSFMKIFPRRLSNISVPKIFFNQALIKIIVILRREYAGEFSNLLSSEFGNRGYQVSIKHSAIAKSKEKNKYRIKFLINVNFKDNVEFLRIKGELLDIKNIILFKLKEVDQKAYEIFTKKRAEIWLKKIRIYIIVHEDFEKETIRLSKELLKGFMDFSSILILEPSLNYNEIIFRLSFDRITDYLITEKDFPYTESDRYTRIGVEKIYKKKFSDALKFLKSGKNGLLGDLYMIESKKNESKISDRMRKKAFQYYRKIGIENFSKCYFENKSKNRILDALETNSDWQISLRLFLEARKLEKKISSRAMEGKNTEQMRYNKWMYRRYSGLKLDKSLDDFIEEIGNFNSSLLGNLQRKCGIPPQEMFGISF